MSLLFFFSFQDEECLCLRHGFNKFKQNHVFYWCQRFDCPDKVRFRCSAENVKFMEPYNVKVDILPPRCVVDIFMLKLVSCVLSHVLEIQRIVQEDDTFDYGMGSVSCERFLGVGWQATFLKSFCTQVDAGDADESGRNLISLNESPVENLARSNPRYLQLFSSTVTLVDDCRDVDLTQVLPIYTEFTLSDLSHSM